MEKKDENGDSSKNKIDVKDNDLNINDSKEKNSTKYQEKDILNNNNPNSNERVIDNEKIKIKEINNEENIILKKKVVDHYGKHRKIGKNVVFLRKYVFGPTNTLWILVAFLLSVAISSYLCIHFLGSFYPNGVYWYLSIYLFFMDFYMILCYITEPGIIPRNHPDFQKNIEEISEKEEKECPIPRIFTERKCPTCNITRPPRASHCAQCDNCVLDFDHHCAFVSNCVGKRNHKYFYYCLIFASLFSIQAVSLHLYAIKYVFITKYKETLYHILKGNKFVFILFILFTLFAFMSIFDRRKPFIKSIIFGIISFGIFLKLWFKYVPINENTPSYYNPFIIVTFFICMGYLFFSNGNLIGQTFVISQNLTIKQQMSIDQKMSQLYYSEKNIKIDEEYTRSRTWKEILINIINLISSKVDKSLIVPERDL